MGALLVSLWVAAAPPLVVDAVTTTPGLKEADARAWVDANLATLFPCVPELLPEDGYDERVWIELRLAAPRCAPGGALHVRGLLWQACADDALGRWKAPKGLRGCDVDLTVKLRLQVDPKDVAAAWAQHRSDAKAVCDAFKARLAAPGVLDGKPAPARLALLAALSDFLAARGARPASAKDGAALEAAARKATLTRDLKDLLVAVAQASPADQPVLVVHGFEDLGFKDYCPELRAWAEKQFGR